jgi:hypothetical protein
MDRVGVISVSRSANMFENLGIDINEVLMGGRRLEKA